jgi:hypothetical protein
MGAMSDVATVLSSSEMASHLSASDAAALSVDMTEIGRYLAMLVEELRVLREAMLILGERIDALDGKA